MMPANPSIPHRQAKHRKCPKSQRTAIDHAVRVIYRICCLAGSASLIDDIRADLDSEGVQRERRLRHGWQAASEKRYGEPSDCCTHCILQSR
jgi:hypothetical protein